MLIISHVRQSKLREIPSFCKNQIHVLMTYLRTYISDNCRPIIVCTVQDHFSSIAGIWRECFLYIARREVKGNLIGTEWWMSCIGPRKAHTRIPKCLIPKHPNFAIFIKTVLANLNAKFGPRLCQIITSDWAFKNRFFVPFFFLRFPFYGPSLCLLTFFAWASAVDFSRFLKPLWRQIISSAEL